MLNGILGLIGLIVVLAVYFLLPVGRYTLFEHTLRIAATERWKDRNDQEHEKTSWFTIVSFADHIVNAVKSKQLAKGRYYRFNGDITMSEYEKDGETRYSPNFQLRRFDHLDRKPE